MGFPGGSEVKAPACNAGDLDLIPGSGRSPGEGNDNPLQYSFLENPMDGGAWWAIVHGVTKSQPRPSDFTSLHFCYWVELCSSPAIYLGPNYGGGNEDKGDLLQKTSCMCRYTSNPCLRWRLLHTHRQVWVSLPGSVLLSPDPGAQGSVCALQESISQSYVSSGSSVVGLMAASFKRAYAIPKSAAPTAPVPAAVHC